MSRRQIPIAQILLCLSLLTPHMSVAKSGSTQSADEYRAKSALLFAFAKFVQWPADTFADDDSPIVFAVIGNDQMFRALQPLTDKRIHGRSIEVIALDSPHAAATYQLLYCDRSTIEAFDRDMPGHLAALHVLTVGEDDGFAETGGVLRLMLIDDHLGFVINATAAQSADLSLGSSLYSLAYAILEESR